MEDLYIGKEFKTSLNSYLIIVKNWDNNNYECKCACGKIIKVNGNDLITRKIKRCNECDNKIIINNTHTKPIKLLCFIWEMYLYLYKNPTTKFNKEIIKKDIRFFPELFEGGNAFYSFCNWSLANGFEYNSNNIYLDRKDYNKDFSITNCFWTKEYKDNDLMINIKFK